MKIKVIIELKNITKNDLEILCEEEEFTGGLEEFIKWALEVGLLNVKFDFDIEYKILNYEIIEKSD